MKKGIKLDSLKSFIDIRGLDPEVTLERKNYVSDIKINEGEEKTAIFRMTCSESDMDGDIVLSSGMSLERYKDNSPVLFAHQHSALPVGVTKEIAQDGNQVVSKIKFADTPFANDVWSLVKLGALKACSIGFIPLESAIRGTKEFDRIISEKGLKTLSSTRRIITKWLLLENSIVNLPCNGGALALAVSEKSLKLTEETYEKLGIENKEVTVEKVEEKPVEKPIETVEEVVKVEEKVEVVEVKPEVKPPERRVTIVRYGGYVPDTADIKMAKMIKKGKIL